MPPKGTKKRKYQLENDPSQPKLDRFLSNGIGGVVKDDPMVIDSVPESSNNKKNIVLGTVRQQSLTPCIVIANAKPTRAQQLPETFFKSSWELQQELLKEIFQEEEDEEEEEEEEEEQHQINYVTASKSVESLCRYGKSEDLFEKLKIELERHVQKMKEDLMSVPVNDNILGRLRRCWNTFCNRLAIIRNVFMELDRSFILPNTKFTSIIQLGKHIFSNKILDSSSFRNVIVSEVLNLIKLDRDNQNVDIKLIQSILQMLIELSYYSSEFESKFLTNTNAYYMTESDLLINQLETPYYIQHAYQRRSQEMNGRIKLYLDVHTKQALANVVTNQLIYSKTELIIKKGFDEMMQKNLLKPLKIFYELLGTNPKMSLLRHAFGEYIKKQGVALIKNPQSDSTMVMEILKFKTSLDIVLKHCFENDKLFQNALMESFEYFMNTRGNKPAELIAKFIDSKLKITKKQPRANEMDANQLDQVLTLFRYIQGKDAFETYYKKFLAKRLLTDKSISIDLERYVLEKLKAECGREFTKKLESMLEDVQNSALLDQDFKAFEPDVSRMPLTVKVVSQAIWPTFPATQIKLPPHMLQTQSLYTKFYTSKHNGKKLIWQDALSSCTLTAQFELGTKEIMASLSQAAILLLFNDRISMPLSEIAKETNLDSKELSRLLVSISTGPTNFLNSATTGTSITYHVNPNFQSSAPRLRVPAPMVDQAVEEKKVEEKVFQNRQHQIDATIVRIMKSKKTATHYELVNEVISQSNFPVEATDIKKRIESLIEKYYLIRDTEDSSVYIYQT